MDPSAPALFQALEHSAFAAAIRQSVWIYPATNIGHVAAMAVFAGAVAVMDVRILAAAAPVGAERISAPRRVAAGALVALAVTGFLLFSAEASHLVLNPVFLLKVTLVALAFLNVLAFERALRANGNAAAGSARWQRMRRAAGVSLALWLAVVVTGRSIAYF
jgi:hypothetical protein